MPAARERVRVARRLRELPLVAGAFAGGRLSYSKVRAVTRVATAATEETLLGLALFATAGQLEAICRTWRQVQAQSDPDAADAQRQRRDLSARLDDDGSLLINGRLPADVGAIVMQALAAAMEVQFRADGPSEEEVGRRRADALGAIAESFLANGPIGSSGADHWQLVVHTEADRLAATADGQRRVETWEYDDGSRTPLPLAELTDDPLGPTPLAKLQNGPTIPNAVLRRIACDAMLIGMVNTADGEPIGVGRRTRVVPGWLRRVAVPTGSGLHVSRLPERHLDRCPSHLALGRRWGDGPEPPDPVVPRPPRPRPSPASASPNPSSTAPGPSTIPTAPRSIPCPPCPEAAARPCRSVLGSTCGKATPPASI